LNNPYLPTGPGTSPAAVVPLPTYPFITLLQLARPLHELTVTRLWFRLYMDIQLWFRLSYINVLRTTRSVHGARLVPLTVRMCVVHSRRGRPRRPARAPPPRQRLARRPPRQRPARWPPWQRRAPRYLRGPRPSRLPQLDSIDEHVAVDRVVQVGGERRERRLRLEVFSHGGVRHIAVERERHLYIICFLGGGAAAVLR
jgi:hypothetical protein